MIRSPIHKDFEEEFDQLIKLIETKNTLDELPFMKKSILEFKDNYKEEYLSHKMTRKCIMGILAISYFGIESFNLLSELKNKVKVKGILSYFKEENYNDEVVEYIIKSTPKEIEKIKDSKKHTISNDKQIQDFAKEDVYLACFSDKNIGGGVLRNGFAQEEHMFIEFPELFILMLIHPKLEKNESIEVRNVIRSCILSGKLQYTKFLKETDKKIITNILLFDSFDFRKRGEETERDLLKIQFNKLLSAFSDLKDKKVVSGNWGCGIFKWSPVSSFLLQLAVCNILGLELIYTTMNKRSLKDIHELIDCKDNKMILKILKSNNSSLIYKDKKFSYKKIID